MANVIEFSQFLLCLCNYVAQKFVQKFMAELFGNEPRKIFVTTLGWGLGKKRNLDPLSTFPPAKDLQNLCSEFII